MEAVMMACGHTSNASKVVDRVNVPFCIICMCDEVLIEKPSLEGRKAKCHYYGTKTHRNECPKCTRGGNCQCIEDSDWKLGFFGFREGQPYDEFYCGCMGWD